jgi:cyclase
VPLVFWTDLTSAAEVGDLLAAGAARVAVQRAALDDPDLIANLARDFGSEAIAVAVTAAGADDGWRVFNGPGGATSEWDALTWAKVVEAQNGGAIIIESPGGGPHGEPYDLELLRSVSSAVAKPVMAAGDANRMEDLFDALMIGDADAVLVSTMLHSGKATLKEIRGFLSDHGLAVQP